MGTGAGARKQLAAGDVVAGKFVVERTIGMGGMGQVVCARHHELGTRVAIKVVHASSAVDPDAIARFKREARAAAALSHEHIVKVFDFGIEDHRPYLVMAHVPGGSLRDRLRDGGEPLDEQLRGLDRAIDAAASR